MADKKIIAVAGATGAQGGGVVRAILSDPGSGFVARALTRDVNSAKAKELAKLGAEVVAADIDNLESVKQAFQGAYGAFCVTFYWAHLSPERETASAVHMAKAAKEAGLKHVIWSTLEDSRRFIPLSDTRMPTLQGKFKVPHFDSKGEADHAFADLGLPVTNLLTSFYWDNFVFFGLGPKKGPDGKLHLTLPMGDSTLAGIAAEDIGKCSLGIFKKGSEFFRKTVGIVGEHLTGAQIAASMSRALGREVLYSPVTPEAFRGFGFPGADDLGNMFQFFQEFADEFKRSRTVEFSRSLNPALLSFEQWLAKNKDRIPLE